MDVSVNYKQNMNTHTYYLYVNFEGPDDALLAVPERVVDNGEDVAKRSLRWFS